MEAKTTITVFSQGATETLCEAWERWERYNFILRRCPNHNFNDLTQIHIFRNGQQQQQLNMWLDATTEGSLMLKNAKRYNCNH